MQRYILISIGLLCVGLGALGIFLPVLPTTPFLLLASWLFYKSSPKLQTWLLNHEILGEYIKNYIVHKAIPLKGKILSVITLWGTILLSIFIFIDNLYLQVFLLIIAIAVTIHIFSFKTLR